MPRDNEFEKLELELEPTPDRMPTFKPEERKPQPGEPLAQLTIEQQTLRDAFSIINQQNLWQAEQALISHKNDKHLAVAMQKMWLAIQRLRSDFEESKRGPRQLFWWLMKTIAVAVLTVVCAWALAHFGIVAPTK